jgi:hypothetical protein
MSPLIGTAGWAIPANDRPLFPAEGTALQRYAAVNLIQLLESSSLDR